MSEGFSFHLDGIDRAGAELQRLGDQVGAGRGGQSARLAGDQGVWGADEEGSAFAVGYAEVAELAAELIDALSSSLDNSGRNLQTMGANVAAADESSIEATNRIATALNTERRI